MADKNGDFMVTVMHVDDFFKNDLPPFTNLLFHCLAHNWVEQESKEKGETWNEWGIVLDRVILKPCASTDPHEKEKLQTVQDMLHRQFISSEVYDPAKDVAGSVLGLCLEANLKWNPNAKTEYMNTIIYGTPNPVFYNCGEDDED